jgi:hypothetical protein
VREAEKRLGLHCRRVGGLGSGVVLHVCGADQTAEMGRLERESSSSGMRGAFKEIADEPR